MKKWLLAVVLNLITVGFSQASEKVAVVNMNVLFQQTAQNTGISLMLENEFKDRAVELQHIEEELQSKIQRLQHDNVNIKADERRKLEKDMLEQRQIFSQKAHIFEQERQRRSNEEREKLIVRIHKAVKKVATDNNIGLVIDANAIAFNNKNIKDITTDVLKQVR